MPTLEEVRRTIADLVPRILRITTELAQAAGPAAFYLQDHQLQRIAEAEHRTRELGATPKQATKLVRNLLVEAMDDPASIARAQRLTLAQAIDG